MIKRTIGIALCWVVLLAQVGRGQTNGWKWLTGGNLKAVKFVGQQGWIIGDDGNQGIILHATNGGDTWAIQPHNTGKHYFRAVSFVDSLNGWIVGGWGGMGEPGFILRTRNGGRTYTSENCPTDNHLNGVSFVDTTYGWVTANTDTIFRTRDGGRSWQGYQPDTNRVKYGGITFLDTLHGWAVSPAGIFWISFTTNGGVTWTSKNDGFINSQGWVDMVDTLHGGTAGLLQTVKTRDGWRTWQSSTPGGGAVLYGISYSDTNNGWAVGGDNNVPATIFHTTNGGANWTFDSTLTKNNAFYGVDAVNGNTAFIVGSGGSFGKTSNSGNNWMVLRNVDIGTRTLDNVSFYNANSGWSVGTYGAITHTTNGGTSWQWQTSGSGNFLYGVDFPSPQRGWLCSDGAEILTTSNAGTTWTFQNSNTTYPLFSIDFPDSDTLYGVAVGGYYGPPEPPRPGKGAMGNWLLADSKSLRPTTTKNFMERDSIKPWGTGTEFWKWPWKPEETNPTTAYRTITRTTNGGGLWIAQNTSGQVPLYGASFITRDEGWACGDPQGGMGVILHTTDSGATWQGQTSNVNQGLYWIHFNNDRLHGWTVGNNGTALWTTDGGTTWNQGNTGITSVLWSCAFYDTLNGFACGNNGLIIRTVDGGRDWNPDTSRVYANLTAVNALDGIHAWTVGSYGMVLGWKNAGIPGVEIQPEARRQIAEDRLEQSYPNPMRENCAISYWLSGNDIPKINIYDITGRRVRSFASLRMTAPGRHIVVWDGRDETGNKVPAGVYFYQLRAKELTETKKLIKIQ